MLGNQKHTKQTSKDPHTSFSNTIYDVGSKHYFSCSLFMLEIHTLSILVGNIEETSKNHVHTQRIIVRAAAYVAGNTGFIL